MVFIDLSSDVVFMNIRHIIFHRDVKSLKLMEEMKSTLSLVCCYLLAILGRKQLARHLTALPMVKMVNCCLMMQI